MDERNDLAGMRPDRLTNRRTLRTFAKNQKKTGIEKKDIIKLGMGDFLIWGEFWKRVAEFGCIWVYLLVLLGRIGWAGVGSAYILSSSLTKSVQPLIHPTSIPPPSSPHTLCLFAPVRLACPPSRPESSSCHFQPGYACLSDRFQSAPHALTGRVLGWYGEPYCPWDPCRLTRCVTWFARRQCWMSRRSRRI